MPPIEPGPPQTPSREDQMLAEAIQEARGGGGRPAREVIEEIRRAREKAIELARNGKGDK